MLLKLATYLAAQGLGTVTNEQGKRPIFAYKQGGEPIDAILLAEGTSGGGLINEELPNYYKAEVQAIVSASSVVKARILADEVIAKLTLREVDIGDGVVIKRCFPRHRPLVFTKNEGQIVEASVNYDITYYEQ